MTLTRGRLGGRTYMLSAAVLAVVIWGGLKALLLFGHPAAALALMAAWVGTGLMASLTIARRLDEAGQAAVRFAWYWGGGGAMALTVSALTAYAALGAPYLTEALRTGLTPVQLIALGAFGLASAQLVGFAIAGAAWWLKR
jgi:hypothetical protein